MTETTPPARASLPASQRTLILDLHSAGAVKFGDYTLKSGVRSPIYIDLRVTVSHPTLLKAVAAELAAACTAPHNLLCGVPYTALPFATAMSVAADTPMVMRRREVKAHGTKKSIEGAWKQGDVCLIVEDLVTSGMSVMETVRPLQEEGMVVRDVVVLLDRQQGARRNLEARGLQLHAVFTLADVMHLLVQEGKVGKDTQDAVAKFIAENQVAGVDGVRKEEESGAGAEGEKGKGGERRMATYGERAEKMENVVGKRLLELMEGKRTNLAVAADVTTKAQLLELAETVGPEICMLKTHADIVSDWDKGTGAALAEIAARHHFLVFEDRKFADIGNTVLQQVSGGVHGISRWADIINAHAVPGPGVISGLARASDNADEEGSKTMGLLLLAEMSSEGNLAQALPGYTAKTIEMAEAERKFVFGFISMGRIAGDEFVYMTPGVKMISGGGDGLGQQYATPDSVVREKGSDVIIVGRGIYKASDPAKEAKVYRLAGWKAYETRCSGLQ